MKTEYEKCSLCFRGCLVDRSKKMGFCGFEDKAYISYYSLHKWEEPPISGERGSGTIFFDGCSLGCAFCQNSKISRGRNGKTVSSDELSDVMLKLQSAGAHNINFVTPTHFLPTVREAIILAKQKGLLVPIVYNTGSYDNPEALKTLSGLVDVYLPDFKFYTEKTAEKYAKASDYPRAARLAIEEMVKQAPIPIFDAQGMMKNGVIVRILLLPGHIAEAKLILKYLYSTYGDNVYISLMSQYTPMANMKPPLNRKVTAEEYSQLVDYAERLGVTYAFVQEGEAASESFIPPFVSGDEVDKIILK